ncbi:leucyl/phenylalanyl-tRNA--protein transferase [Pseudofulvibacter geojedonensis]|uniref:Leucyl/phenylalanyl-tRNA--protein transferase n=1 Tax=Pseudofulvibacter geojedonensis TaxID=1123758 RepID=A0ABW3I1H3_9FLAO
MHILSKELLFPNPVQASPEGLLAIGGDLSIERLLLAYNSGIFPWYSEEEPILWWSPDPRMVLFPEELKVSKSMKQLLKKEVFQVTYNTCFERVIENCAKIYRPDQEDTWITLEMIEAYKGLHRLGIAVSVEVWKEDELVGGLYGIDLKDKKIFCGESMFSKVSNASKYGFICLVEKLKQQDYRLIDCQVHTDHLESLGAKEIDREVFLSYL